MKVSVALLTKNSGPLLRECVGAIRSQAFPGPFEILAIDSASWDGSAHFLARQPGVRLVQIAAADFQHGRTRNLAMRSTTGELVAFLTQDAVPTSSWLAELVDFMDAHPHVAGAFGHQIPHADGDPLEAFEVSGHFESFRNGPVEFRHDPQLPNDDARARRHFFSNVNSCIRRSAWQGIPFPEVDFGEDQAWALAVQSSGGVTGYAERAVVMHSHDYGPLTLLRRRYDEARFMKRQFGYRLMPTWPQARQTAVAHSHLFRDHLATLEGHGGLAGRINAATRAWAAAIGRFAGTRLADGDGRLHSLLSLAERQRRA